MEEIILKVLQGEWCTYCNCETQLVSGETVYPHLAHANPRPKFISKSYFMCIRNLDHYVGTYKDDKTSLGRVADKNLRILKKQGHDLFDPLWRSEKYFKNQNEAYLWLSEKMKLPMKFTHFGMFTNDQCNLAIQFCKDLKR
jgi:hypothetical protein